MNKKFKLSAKQLVVILFFCFLIILVESVQSLTFSKLQKEMLELNVLSYIFSIITIIILAFYTYLTRHHARIDFGYKATWVLMLILNISNKLFVFNAIIVSYMYILSIILHIILIFVIIALRKEVL